MLVYPPPCGSAGASGLQLESNGVPLATPTTTLDVVGASLVDDGGGHATLTISGGAGILSDQVLVPTGDPRVYATAIKVKNNPFFLYHNGRRMKVGLEYTLTESVVDTGYDTVTLIAFTPQAGISVFLADYVAY